MEERRPGISKIVAELKAAHPGWPEHRLLAEAKVIWHERNKLP